MSHGKLVFAMPSSSTEAFVDAEDGRCIMTYTFTIHLRPRWLGTIFDPLAGVLFRSETRRRFSAMARYLSAQRSHKSVS